MWLEILFATLQIDNTTNCTIFHLKKMQKIEKILRYALMVVAFLVPFIADAQEDSVAYRRECRDYRVSVDFKVNSTKLDPNYRQNNTVISRVDSILTMIKEDSTIVVNAVEFSGSASPEGNLQSNKRLSRARMKAVEKFVRDHISFADDIVLYDDRYVDWNQLIEFVEADTTLAKRDEVLKICRGSYADVKLNNGVSIDGRIPAIKKLDNGVTWKTLLNRYFVKMRTGTITLKTYVDVPFVVERPKPEPTEEPAEVIPTEVEQTDDTQAEETMEETPAEESTDIAETGVAEQKHKPALMSIKTNLLAYSTLIPNLGTEFRLADHWSAEITAMYSPFDLFKYNRKTRVLAAKPEVRYWFGEAMQGGHFVGLHVPIAGFNIQLEDNFRYQDPKHALWGIGLNYGYALRFGKEEKWALDFTLGIGFMDISYNIFEGVHNGKYVRTEEKYYFGPTRVGVNLSYIINKAK